MKLSQHRHLLLFLLFLSLLSCRSSSDKQAAALLREGDKISEQELKLFGQWAREFGQVFSEENRAQFPANRDWLNSHSQSLLPRIDESLRLGNAAADKYEEASHLISNEQQRRAWTLVVASVRRNIEIEQLLKEQAQLVSDLTITDATTFNEKFAQIGALMKQKVKEKDAEFDEGKRLMLKR